jgi:hypothetical protein
MLTKENIMRIISWNWFWYVLLGFIMGGGALYLYTVLKEKGIKLAWHELALTIVSFATFLFMGQTFIASFNEGEPRAAWLTIVFMGLPIIMMAVVVLRSVRDRMTLKQQSRPDSPRHRGTGKLQPAEATIQVK